MSVVVAYPAATCTSMLAKGPLDEQPADLVTKVTLDLLEINNLYTLELSVAAT